MSFAKHPEESKEVYEIPLADDKAILKRTPIQYCNNHTTLTLPKQMAQ